MRIRQMLGARRFLSSAAGGKDYDVVIVGGGMVGAALGALLGASPVTRDALRVAVVERANLDKMPSPTASPHPSLRVSTLSHASMRVLDAAGAWQPMLDTGRVSSFSHMTVWDGLRGGQVNYSGLDVGEANLGWVAENLLQQRALLDVNEHESPNVDLLYPAEVTGLEYVGGDADSAHSVRLETSEGEMTAGLVVGSDGPMSQVRGLMGLQSTGFAYNQSGVVATVRLTEPTATAWQRMLPTGPVALLPVGGTAAVGSDGEPGGDAYASIVWSLPHERAAAVVEMDEDDFLEALRAALEDRLDAAPTFSLPVGPLAEIFGERPSPTLPTMTDVVGPRARFPLRMAQTLPYAKARMALFGDSAHSVHPLAGQGVNLGYADAACLAQSIGEAVRTGTDPGEGVAMDAYVRERIVRTTAMMAGVDAIKRLFSNDLGPLAVLRSAGLAVTDRVAPLKREVIRFASGQHIDTTNIGRFHSW